MLRATRPWAIRTTLFAMVCSACGVVPTASEVETEESGEALSASAEVAALNLDPNSEDEKLLILTANTLSEETLVASVSRGGAGVGRTAGRNLVRARSGPSASDPADDRPFKSLVEIASVSGVGVSTLKRLRDYGRAHRDELVAVESPRTEPPAVAFRTVHAGAAYSCGILLDGRVLC